MLEIKINCFTKPALEVLKEHMKDSKKLKNRIQLRAFGISQELSEKDKSLVITFGKLMEKIIKKGGKYAGVKEEMKDNFLKDVFSEMKDAGVSEDDWEVVINE